MSTRNVLEIAVKCNEILENLNIGEDICFPELVCIGAQSGGKSTTLNRLIGVNILPTGNGIVTKTPIEIISRYNDSELTIIISYDYEDRNIIKKFNNEDDVINEIKTITSILTKDICISEKPIKIKIFSRKSPNLNLVDLPGIIAIASSFEHYGIVDKLKNLSKKYLNKPKTIAMVVVENGQDLVTNIGLALAKEIEFHNKKLKTIGILTKVDNKPELVYDIIKGNIQENINFKNGYFAINNKCENEDIYFNDIKIGKETNEFFRCGIKNLSTYLTTMLTDSISIEIPILEDKIRSRIENINLELLELGNDIEDNSTRISIITKIITKISIGLNDAIESNGIEFNIGHNLRDLFNEFNKNLLNINVFSDIDIKYFLNKIESFRGYREYDMIKVGNMIEKCISDASINPIDKLLCICNDTVAKVINMLELAIKYIIKNNEDIKKYDNLDYILSSYYISEIRKKEIDLKNSILEFIEIEKNVVHTYNDKFISNIKKFTYELSEYSIEDGDIFNKKVFNMLLFDENQINILKINNGERLKLLCESYTDIIKKNLCDFVIKNIIVKIVRHLQFYITSKAITNFSNDIYILKENTIVKEKRRNLNNINKKLKDICLIFDK